LPSERTRPSGFTLGALIAGLLATVGAFSWVAVKSYDLIHGEDLRPGAPGLKSVDIAGPQQTVFSWRRQACERRDIPDMPARAFRDAEGRVHLIDTHYVSRSAVGPGLNHVRHDCRIVMRSKLGARPQLFSDREWIASPYTLDGKTVFALVHDEYRGNQHTSARCLYSSDADCLYNAITLARSDNGGLTFRHALPPPRHLVAEVPYPYDPAAGTHYGVFMPSNIVKKGDWYYSMVALEPYRAQKAGACVMRTRNLADPSAWRAWDGNGFDVTFVDPYTVRDAASGDHFCEPVSSAQIGSMVQSLTYNTYFGKYLLVGTSDAYDQRQRRVVSGFYYSLSNDLIHWSMRKLVREVELPGTYRCGDADPVLYPSVLDPTSKSRNFETSGRRPYLYFTRFHYSACRQGYDRDLVRVPIEFSK
jgi:hypothetical protein